MYSFLMSGHEDRRTLLPDFSHLDTIIYFKDYLLLNALHFSGHILQYFIIIFLHLKNIFIDISFNWASLLFAEPLWQIGSSNRISWWQPSFFLPQTSNFLLPWIQMLKIASHLGTYLKPLINNTVGQKQRKVRLL